MAVHSDKLRAVDLMILPVDVSHVVRQLVQKYIHAGAVVATVAVDNEVERRSVIYVPVFTPPQSGFPRLVDDYYLY